jgi:hypothetical protein
MPSTVNLHLIGVWFCVGFFTGAGWAIATWLVGRIIFFILPGPVVRNSSDRVGAAPVRVADQFVFWNQPGFRIKSTAEGR